MRHHHIICRKNASIRNMYSINSKQVKERYSVTPTKPKESACNNNNHRKNIQHEIDKAIAKHVFFNQDKHFTRMFTKLVNTECVKRHDRKWRIFAKPPEKFQYTFVVPIPMPH